MSPEIAVPVLERITNAAARGTDEARRYAAGRLLLKESELGSFSTGARPSSVALRRALLRAGIPARALALLRPLAARLGRLQAYARFVERYAYWRGVHHVLIGNATWQGLLRPPVILMYHAVGGTGEPAPLSSQTSPTEAAPKQARRRSTKAVTE